MDTEAVQDAAVDTAQRIAKGYLNGTTKAQSYGILATVAVAGAVSGVAATMYFVKKRFILEPKMIKVPREH
jgi:hypothetical protein